MKRMMTMVTWLVPLLYEEAILPNVSNAGCRTKATSTTLALTLQGSSSLSNYPADFYCNTRQLNMNMQYALLGHTK